MDLRLDGKTAIVTGGSKGIGRGIAQHLADAGANVMITARKADVLEAAAAEMGPNVSWIVGHTGQVEDGQRVVDETIKQFGSVDILVNNAATNPHAGPVIDCDLSKWDKTHEVNLRGILAWTQIAWNSWMKEHGGCVINIASVGGFKTSTQLGVYAIFKAALIHMTKQLAAELSPGVRVNCIAPGLIKTDFARILWEGERGEQVAQSYPLKRLGEPSDIGELALWICASGSWMTGQTIAMDGGELIKFIETDIE